MGGVDLDVSGLVCPQPIQVVRRCLAELDPGEELVVTGDYPPAQRSIFRTCYKHGYDVDLRQPVGDDGTFTISIRVTEDASPTEPVVGGESDATGRSDD